MASRRYATRLRVAPLVAAIAAVWLVLLVGPAEGVTRGSTRLTSPDVSPRSGTTKTAVTFTVVYQNREGSPPDWVRVTVGGATHEMRALDPLDRAKDGVRYSFRSKLPVGTHSVVFTSRGRDKFEASVAGGKVTIKKAVSGSSGGGGTSPGSGGGGGTSPGSGGGGSGGGTSPGSGGGGSGGGSSPAAPAPVPTVAPLLVSPLDLEPAEPAVGGQHEAADPATLPAGIIGLRPGPADPGGDRGGGPGAGGGGRDAASIPGARLPGKDLGKLLPTAVLASTLTTVTIAFLIFGKRRRDEEPPAPDDELASAAALPYAFAPAGALAYAPATVTGSIPAFDPGTGGTDVDLPRWRRPSLIAARKHDPLRDAGEASHLTFGARSASAGARERRVVRYRIVRLLDRPDEMLGAELGTLDEGDEVEILERRGTYRRVLTPDGREGWVHKMTLGDVVGDEAAVAAADPDIDPDVLLAYLAARARN